MYHLHYSNNIVYLPNLDINSKLCLGERSDLWFTSWIWRFIVSKALKIESWNKGTCRLLEKGLNLFILELLEERENLSVKVWIVNISYLQSECKIGSWWHTFNKQKWKSHEWQQWKCFPSGVHINIVEKLVYSWFLLLVRWKSYYGEMKIHKWIDLVTWKDWV